MSNECRIREQSKSRKAVFDCILMGACSQAKYKQKQTT